MDLNRMLKAVDHTLLSQTATWEDIKRICDEGMKYGVASACIPPCYVKDAKEYVNNKLAICTVIVFPNGYSTTESKIFECGDAISNGADELDMVVNIGLIKSKKFYEVENEKRHLDKDILFKDSKIYSPETCVFVPQRINALFVKSNGTRGDHPIGVYFHKREQKYVAQCRVLERDQQKFLGYFNTPKEAFQRYKEFKEEYIKQVAEEYKDKIPMKLYEAMLKWEVEITD